MNVYAIGDVQGCFSSLQQLLDKINFDNNKDILWFTGDLVNRGKQSLSVLRFIKALGEQHITVLGNHDLHLLAVAAGAQIKRNDTLDEILTAPDRDELLQWLISRPLLHYDEKMNYALVHAGIAPSWSITKALGLADEVQVILRSGTAADFLRQMYGNQPDLWRDDLTGVDRLRCIINYLTRMRFCYPDGRLDLVFKGKIEQKPAELIPWFLLPGRVNQKQKIIFGHWAALGGATDQANLFALDTGCVWGHALTAMHLGDNKRFSVKC